MSENGFMAMIKKNPVTTGFVSFAVLAILIVIIVLVRRKNNNNTTPKPTTKEGFSFSDTFSLSSLSNMSDEDADHILGTGYQNEENGYEEIVENFPQPAPMNVMYSDANGNLATTTDLGVEYVTVTRDSTVSGNSTVKGNSSVSGNMTVSGDPNAEKGSSILANGGNWKPVISVNAPVAPESLYSIHFGDGKDVHNRQTGIGYITGQPKATFGKTRGTLATHIHSDDDYQIVTSGWDPIFAVKGGSGEAFIKGSLSTGGSLSSGGNISTSKNLHTKRNRVCFSDTATDANHSIYNNYTNIDGEGGWDGMKMNTYAGLDVRTGNASGAVPATRLSVRDSGISVNGNISSTGALSAGSIQIGSWKISEDSSGHLVFSRAGAGWDSSRGTNEGHIRMTQDGNLWLSRSTGWGWTADKLGAIEKDLVVMAVII